MRNLPDLQPPFRLQHPELLKHPGDPILDRGKNMLTQMCPDRGVFQNDDPAF